MPTVALIQRGGALMRLSQALWQVSRDEPDVWSQSRREVDIALEGHRRDVAEHHRQEEAKTAALNHRLQRRHASVGE